MKRYPHCIQKLFYEPLVITPARHSALCRVLEARLGSPGASLPDAPDIDPDDDDEEEPLKPDWETFGADAIIPVHGVLVAHARDIPMSSCGCGLDVVNAMIDIAMADAEVNKLIFDFDTPGGGVTGIPELAAKIAGITSKATIGFTDSECCSGGMWLASACQYFYSTGSASVGSIGVWTAYTDISRYLANQGENVQAISAGKYKLLGAYWKPLADDERQLLQADVDKIYGQFKEAINLRRAVEDQWMQGQIYDGERAVELGLADGLVDGIDELLSEEEED